MENIELGTLDICLLFHFWNYLLQINKEKCQAVVEFLTPEDATSAISFDGRYLSGSVLKIRRPKDFVEAAVRFLYLPILPIFSFFLSAFHFSVFIFISLNVVDYAYTFITRFLYIVNGR